MKRLTTSALALCLLVLVGCAEGNAPDPQAADIISAANNKVQANITGMECTGCSGSVEAAIKKEVKGVEAARADVASGEVIVALADDADAQAAKAEIEKVIAELQNGKFTVKTIAVSTASDRDGHEHPAAKTCGCNGECKGDKEGTEPVSCPSGCSEECDKETQAQDAVETAIETVEEEATEVVTEAAKDIQVPALGSE